MNKIRYWLWKMKLRALPESSRAPYEDGGLNGLKARRYEGSGEVYYETPWRHGGIWSLVASDIRGDFRKS